MLSVLPQVVVLKFEDVSLEASQQAPDIKTAKRCVAQVQELVFQGLSKAISDRLISSVNYLRESVVGTLQRCLERLEDSLLGEGQGGEGRGGVDLLEPDYIPAMDAQLRLCCRKLMHLAMYPGKVLWRGNYFEEFNNSL